MSKKNTKKTTRSISDMEAQRREIDRQIRSAKRAEKKAAEVALLSARQSLGVDLAKAVGADNVEAVRLLRSALESGQITQWLKAQIGTASSDNPVPGTGQSEVGTTEGGGHDELA